MAAARHEIVVDEYGTANVIKFVPDDLETNCTRLINSKRGYRLNEIMDENKIEVMMQNLFEKINNLLKERMSKIE